MQAFPMIYCVTMADLYIYILVLNNAHAVQTILLFSCHKCDTAMYLTIIIMIMITQGLKVLIYSANQQPRPVVIIVFTYVVRLSVRPTFQNLAKQSKYKVKTMFNVLARLCV